MSAIYLVVLYDRHCDDQYVARHKFSDAIAAADQLIGAYGSRYKWVQEEDSEQWLYRHSTGFDEGPNIHIEKVELK